MVSGALRRRRPYEPLANGMLAGHRAAEDLARVVGEDYMEWPFWRRLFSPGRLERSQAVVDGMHAIAGGTAAPWRSSRWRGTCANRG